jgi:hypothetical protein
MFYSIRKLEKIDEFAKVEQYLRRVENGWKESWTMDGSNGVGKWRNLVRGTWTWMNMGKMENWLTLAKVNNRWNPRKWGNVWIHVSWTSDRHLKKLDFPSTIIFF